MFLAGLLVSWPCTAQGGGCLSLSTWLGGLCGLLILTAHIPSTSKHTSSECLRSLWGFFGNVCLRVHTAGWPGSTGFLDM